MESRRARRVGKAHSSSLLFADSGGSASSIAVPAQSPLSCLRVHLACRRRSLALSPSLSAVSHLLGSRFVVYASAASEALASCRPLAQFSTSLAIPAAVSIVLTSPCAYIHGATFVSISVSPLLAGVSTAKAFSFSSDQSLPRFCPPWPVLIKYLANARPYRPDRNFVYTLTLCIAGAPLIVHRITSVVKVYLEAIDYCQFCRVQCLPTGSGQLCDSVFPSSLMVSVAK